MNRCEWLSDYNYNSIPFFLREIVKKISWLTNTNFGNRLNRRETFTKFFTF